MGSSYCWGVFREVAHSPGRESDDAEILRLTGKQLEARGLQVILKTPDEVNGVDDVRPRFVFLMCERVEVLGKLRALEASGVPHVNTPQAVLNTYRERMIDVQRHMREEVAVRREDRVVVQRLLQLFGKLIAADPTAS